MVTWYGSVITEASERDFLASLGLTVADYDYELGPDPVSVRANLTVDVTHYLTAMKHDLELLPYTAQDASADPNGPDSKARSATRVFLEFQLAESTSDEARCAELRDRLKALLAVPREAETGPESNPVGETQVDPGGDAAVEQTDSAPSPA